MDCHGTCKVQHDAPMQKDAKVDRWCSRQRHVDCRCDRWMADGVETVSSHGLCGSSMDGWQAVALEQQLSCIASLPPPVSISVRETASLRVRVRGAIPVDDDIRDDDADTRWHTPSARV